MAVDGELSFLLKMLIFKASELQIRKNEGTAANASGRIFFSFSPFAMRAFSTRITEVARESLRTALRAARKMGEPH
ncbi:MAG: hypothetical protein II926_09525 [Bacteroidales bacterium]|nr:hypothetical protein [Bacteroidales bacterium]